MVVFILRVFMLCCFVVLLCRVHVCTYMLYFVIVQSAVIGIEGVTKSAMAASTLLHLTVRREWQLDRRVDFMNLEDARELLRKLRYSKKPV